MSLEITLFRKKNIINKVLLNFAFFFLFVYLFPGFNDEKSHNTLLVFKEEAIEHILRAKVWLYGFVSVFWQKLTDFLFVVYLLFFL